MKKLFTWVIRILISLLVICGSIALIYGFFGYGLKDFMVGRSQRIADMQHKYVDTIEVYLIQNPGGGEPIGTFPDKIRAEDYSIYGKVVLTGEEAQFAAERWNWTHKDQRFAAMCHDPPYGVRMWSQGEVIFETSICWKCSTFPFEPLPGMNTYYGFNSSEKSAQELLALFDSKLPYPRPKKKERGNPKMEDLDR